MCGFYLRRLSASLLSCLCFTLACGPADSGVDPATTQTPAAPDHLKRLHASDLTKGFGEKGLACKAPKQERDMQHWVCESATPLVQYLEEFKISGNLSRLVFEVKAPGSEW